MRTPRTAPIGAMVLGAMLMVAAAATISCSRTNAAEAQRLAQAAESTKVAEAARAREAARPRIVTMVIPAGTDVVMRLETPLSTEANHAGDSFYGTTMQAVLVEGRTVVPAGARITGSLRAVQEARRVSGRASMTLVYSQIVDAQGKTHAISADPLTLQAKSTTTGDVEKIAGGAALGALIGGLTHGGKGAAVGAGAGAGAGTIVVLATQGDEVTLAAGQQLNVHLTTATSIALTVRR